MAGDAMQVDTSQLRDLSRDLGKAGFTVGARAFKIVSHFGLQLQAKVKANAAGRPGPRMQTGDYNRSIELQVGIDGGAPTARVGTNRPQGRRLELGFSGTDSLGRTYNQPPFPHFGPALDEIGPAFEAAVAGIMDGIDLGPGPPTAPLTYTTKAGVTREATAAQIANWTRGRQ